MPSQTHSLFIALLLALLVAASATAKIESQKLEPLHARSSNTLFVEQDPTSIGVDSYSNNYSNPDLWTKRWHEYLHGAAGTGVAVGDLNGDGLPEILAVSKDETTRLFLNEGGFSFVDVTTDAGLDDSQAPATGAAMADVNDDGHLDLYLTYLGAENQLWINDGAGRFTEQAAAWGVDINGASGSAAFADYDRDGDLDFYLQNNLIQSGSAQIAQADRLFRNEGKRFVETTRSAGIEGEAKGHSATWWDYNDDGWPDLYVANDYMPPDKLYRNNQDGTFTDVLPVVAPQMPYSSMGSDFGDINNDGRIDFWGTDMATSDRAKHMQTSPSLVINYTQATVGSAYQYPKNALLLKTGESRFTDIAYLAGLARTDWTWSSRLADFDNDGWLDAFVANGMIRELHFKDMAAKLEAIQSPYRIPIAFKNQPPLFERNLAYRNSGDLAFSEIGPQWGLDEVGVSFGAATGDLDGDGDLDLVVSNFQEPLSVYRNNEDSSHRASFRLLGIQSNAYGIGARVVATCGPTTQTRLLYPTRGYLSSSQPIVHFGMGAAETIDVLEVHWPSGAYQRFEDLPAGRHYRITEAQSPTAPSETRRTYFQKAQLEWPEQAERRESYFNEFHAQPLHPLPEARLGGSLAIADLNDDGLNDVVLGGSVGQSAMVALNGGEGRFATLPSFDLEDDFFSEDQSIAVSDLDLDGDSDLFISSGGVEAELGSEAYADRVYLNQGEDFLRDWDSALSRSLQPSGAAAFGDYDGDGDPDLFVAGATIPGAYPHSSPSRLWRNDNSAFVLVEELVPALEEIGRVSDAQWVDLDGDGDFDLVLAREWAPIAIMENKDGALSPDPQTLEGSGLWTAAHCEDLDGDGDMDIFAGNLGLNTEYSASADRPVRLWYNKNSAGEVKLIETQRYEGRDWPIQERWMLERSFPKKMDAIGSEEAYAVLSLQDMFSDQELSAYEALRVDELRSGIFWQNEDGSFDFTPLPAFAQSGRVMSVVVNDVNHDGRQDLIAALQPLYPDPWSLNVEQGDLALLLNKGERAFEILLPGDSGLEVEGSPRDLALGDLVGDASPDLLVYLSDGFPQAFQIAPPKD